METFAILRRGGWRTADEFREAAARSTIEGENMPDDIRWIRSYVTREKRRHGRNGLHLPGIEPGGHSGTCTQEPICRSTRS